MSYAEKHLINLNETVITLVGTGIKQGASWRSGTQGGTVRRWGLVLNNATSATGAVVQLIRRPTPGNASGQVVIGSLTLDAVTPAGTTVYSNAMHAQVLPGEEVVVNVVTAPTGGDATYVFMEMDPDWETPGNFKAAMLNRNTP